MIDEDKLLNEVFDKPNKMSKEELIKILKKAGLPILEEEKKNDS